VDDVVSASRADLFNQAAFLAHGTFVDSDGKRTKAFLKFAWWETSQQTECEVYGVLHWKGVPHVPELLLSGYVDEWVNGSSSAWSSRTPGSPSAITTPTTSTRGATPSCSSGSRRP
ncbi:hypothetical protein EV182_008387, partial [Spiromyces aspiralis]